MNLGEKISRERKRKGFSQELLAENAGISLRTIQRIENNRSVPRPFTLKAIADALEIEISELAAEPHTASEPVINSDSLLKIKLINSSALLGIILPLFNMIMPVIFWKRYKADSLVNEKGKKIISFQMFWFFFSLLVLAIIQFLQIIFTGQVISGRLPLVVGIYIILLTVNMFFIIKNSMLLRKGTTDIYPFIPNLF